MKIITISNRLSVEGYRSAERIGNHLQLGEARHHMHHLLIVAVLLQWHDVTLLLTFPNLLVEVVIGRSVGTMSTRGKKGDLEGKENLRLFLSSCSL